MSVETNLDDGVLRIILRSAPTKNALDPKIVGNLRKAIRIASSNRGVALVTIESAVKGVFSIGMDLNLLAGPDGGQLASQSIEQINAYVELLVDIARLPAPMLAVVDGLAVGGGVDIACSCDLLLSTYDAGFSIAQLSKGVFPWTTSAVLVPRIGVARFTQWALSGVTYGAKQLFNYGLVTQACERSELGRTSSNLISRIKGFDRQILSAGFAGLRNMDESDRVARLRSVTARLTHNCAVLRENH